jgi:hypothetical protein
MGTIPEPMYRQFQGNSPVSLMQGDAAPSGAAQNATPTDLGSVLDRELILSSEKTYHAQRKPIWALRSGDSDL